MKEDYFGMFGLLLTSSDLGQLAPFQDADGSYGHILVLIRKLYTLYTTPIPPSLSFLMIL